MKIVRLLSASAAIVVLASPLHAITITEDFNSASPGGNPYARGWSAVGDTNLFAWNSAEGNLAVTWDSAKPNSFFHQPVGMTLNKTNDFSIGFDFKLLSLQQYPEKSFSFQLAIGFINLEEATNTNYFRGGAASNVAEFVYFPDTGYPAVVTPQLISSNGQYAVSSTEFVFETNQLYRIEMQYSGESQTLLTHLKQNGTNVFTNSSTLSASFSDVALDTVSISSYNDGGQFPGYEGSILANAIIDNIVVTMPTPLIGRIAFTRNGSVNQASVFCQPGATYALQRTTNFQSWTNVASAVAVSSRLMLQDTNTAPSAFYRIVQQP